MGVQCEEDSRPRIPTVEDRSSLQQGFSHSAQDSVIYLTTTNSTPPSMCNPDGFNSTIIKNAQNMMQILYNGHQKHPVKDDTFQVLTNSMASRMIYEMQCLFLWLSTECAWVLEQSDPCPLTPSIEVICKSIKMIQRCVTELEYKSEILRRASRIYRERKDLEIRIKKVWQGGETLSDIDHNMAVAWGEKLSPHLSKFDDHMVKLRAIKRREWRNSHQAQKEVLDMISTSFGIALEQGKEGKPEAELEDAACKLGKDLISIFAAKFLFSITQNQVLLGWYKRWRLSFSEMQSKKQVFSPCCLLRRFTASLQHAEENVALIRAGKPVTKLEVQLLTGRQEQVLEEVERLILRTEMSLEEQTWTRATDPSSQLHFI